MNSRLVPLIETDVTRGGPSGPSHDDGGFTASPYQAAMHAQRRTVPSTLRYSVLVVSGLVLGPLIYPGVLTFSHTTLQHGAIVAGVMVAMMWAARDVWWRFGPSSRAYRVAWIAEAAFSNIGFLTLAYAGAERGFVFWLLFLVQVFLIAMEDASTAFPRIMFGVGPIAIAALYCVQGRYELAVWAVVMGGVAQVMCFELQKIGRRLSAEVRERQALAHRLSELSKYEERARIAEIFTTVSPPS